MPEAGIPHPNPEITAENLSETIADIYQTDSTPDEQAAIRKVNEGIVDPRDVGGVELYKNLRQTLESLDSNDGWEAEKQAARAELSQIQSDYLEQILKRLVPFIKNLPAGHGKGHMLRDAINLTGMLNDPELSVKKLDEVELFVGCTAGLFHDNGNSIVDRYEDVNRVGAHAEVGAVLFGEAAKGILPPHLIRLTQYAIAAHTHYLSPQDVELANGTRFTKRTYNSFTGNSGREAIWMARQTDRRDTACFAQIVRDMIIHVKPIQDYSGESFYEKQKDDENFAAWYGLSPESIDKGIVGHEMMYCRNVFKDNQYTSHDSEYFTRSLMAPGVGDFILFLSVIAPAKKDELLADIEHSDPESANRLKDELGYYTDAIKAYRETPLTEEGVANSISKFSRICRAVEPAADLENQLESFETQFGSLSAEDQAKWARGLSFMSDVLFGRWMDRLAKSVSAELRLGDKIISQNPATQQKFDEIGRHLRIIAQDIISSMEQAGPNFK